MLKEKRQSEVQLHVYETSRTGGGMRCLHAEEWENSNPSECTAVQLHVATDQRRQRITGFGGSFTDASAFLIGQLSPAQRHRIMKAYFHDEGARYSLTRTHMNSCDFSRYHYSYAPVEGDLNLEQFSIDPDRAYLIPMILTAQQLSSEGFKIIASPWTAPPWMKTNGAWVGGELRPELAPTWAHFFAKYAQAYKEEGVSVWGFTVVNEPHGNGNNWESMHCTPDQMTQFVQHHLKPTLELSGLGHLKILGYDQNREGLDEWVAVMYRDEASARGFDGTAVHWYESTVDYFPEALERAHASAPLKHLIQTEACCDAQVPVWRDDDWYWRAEATDWGFTWREPEKKHLHPRYAPVHRYARDIIGCLNHWVDGWVDWNMVLDRQGGPNWFENWCIAPVIVDIATDEVYFTPLYDVMCHFSKFIRPGDVVLKSEIQDAELQAVAIETVAGNHVVVAFNPSSRPRELHILGIPGARPVRIGAQTLLTIKLTSLPS